MTNHDSLFEVLIKWPQSFSVILHSLNGSDRACYRLVNNALTIAYMDREPLSIDRNIEEIHKMRVESDKKRRRDYVWIDEAVAFAGSTNSLYAHLLVYCSWMALHFVSADTRHFLIGAKFEDISLAATLEAIFLSLFVLINQRRMRSVERRNADLDLQMSLLVEQEITKIARVTSLIAQKVGVTAEALNDLAKANVEVKPADIINKISDVENKNPTHLTSDPTGKNGNGG